MAAAEQVVGASEIDVQAFLRLVGRNLGPLGACRTGCFVQVSDTRRAPIPSQVCVSVHIHVVGHYPQLPVVHQLLLQGSGVVHGLEIIVHPPCARTGGAGEIGLLAIGEQQRNARRAS
ncbi:hypothetical protein D3C79_817460 [compost metagenome]